MIDLLQNGNDIENVDNFYHFCSTLNLVPICNNYVYSGGLIFVRATNIVI